MPPLSSWVIHFLFVGFLFFFGGNLWPVNSFITTRFILVFKSQLSSQVSYSSFELPLSLSLSLLLVISLGFLCQIAGELNRLPLHIRPAFNEQIVANRGKSFQGEFHAITLGEMFSTRPESSPLPPLPLHCNEWNNSQCTRIHSYYCIFRSISADDLSWLDSKHLAGD